MDSFIIISLNHTVQKRLNIELSWNRFACEVSSAVSQPRFSQVTIISTFYSVYQIHDRCALRIKTNNITAVFYFFLFLFYYAIQGKSITWLVNSTLNCTRKPCFAIHAMSVFACNLTRNSLVRQWIFLKIDLR